MPEISYGSPTVSGSVEVTTANTPTNYDIKTGWSTGGALNNSGQTVYTVTTGKDFYMTSFFYYLSASAGVTLQIRDGTTIVWQYANDNATAHLKQLTFPTPIKFTTSVVFFCTNTTTTQVLNCAGYELDE